MNILWMIQHLDNQGTLISTNTEVLFLNSGQEFPAGYARLKYDGAGATLEIVENHDNIDINVGEQVIPVTLLNQQPHTQKGVQPFSSNDVLQALTPQKDGGADITTIAILADGVPATIKI